MKKLSIITPSFNQGKYIERTIESVLNQNIPDLEYIIIDGGSTDNTLSILKNYAEKISYVSEADFGQAHAVNKGLKKINSEIIGWLNSDDIYYPGTLKSVINFFHNYPEVDVLYGAAYHIDENDQIINIYPTETFNLKRLTQTCFISQPAVFFRKNCLKKFGMLNEKLNFCMDYEYWLRLALKGANFNYCSEVFAGSRLYPATKTMSFPLPATEEAIKMLKDQINYVPITWIINYAVGKAKTLTKKHKFNLKYLSLIFIHALSANFKLNGCLKGIINSVMLPFALLELKIKRI